MAATFRKPERSKDKTELSITYVDYHGPITTPLSVNIGARAPPAPNIKPKTEKLELNRVDNPYTIVPLAENAQGGRSHSFKIKGGFEDSKSKKIVPAILKRVFDTKWKDDMNSDTVKEIKFLTRPSIDLHLFSTWSNHTKITADDPSYQIDIVVRDVTAEDPPFKSFLDWYVENKDIKAIDGLRNTMRNIKERLMWYAMNENLIYHDFAMLNIFIRKQAMETLGGATRGSVDSSITVMPVDWGLPDDDTDYAGVEDIYALNEEDKQEQIQAYEEELDDDLEDSFNTHMLATELMKTHNQKLRSHDIKKVAFNEQHYELLHFKTLPDYTDMYAIYEELEGKMSEVPGFMYVVDLKKNDGMDRIRRAKNRGRFVSSEEADDELLIFCRIPPES